MEIIKNKWKQTPAPRSSVQYVKTASQIVYRKCEDETWEKVGGGPRMTWGTLLCTSGEVTNVTKEFVKSLLL